MFLFWKFMFHVLVYYLSIVEVKIALRISGSFLVSRQTNPFPAGSFEVSLSAWSPRDPMKMAKALTLSFLVRILAKLVGEIPYRSKLASDRTITKDSS